MTREEAITVLKAFMENPLFSDAHKQAFNIAIHDIKQRHDWDNNNLILINKDNYEPQEPKTGHWYDKWGKDGCSVCNEGIDDAQTFDGRPFKYCPMCGARMVEPQESEDKE